MSDRLKVMVTVRMKVSEGDLKWRPLVISVIYAGITWVGHRQFQRLVKASHWQSHTTDAFKCPQKEK